MRWLIALFRRGRGRAQADSEDHDPAATLRAKLAEGRAAESDSAPEGEVVPESSEKVAADPEARREEIHAKARSAIEELR